MRTHHVRAAIFALGSLAVLPSCSSMMNMNKPAQTSSAAPAPMPTQSAVSPDMVKQVQAKLQEGGFYKGPTDGVYGPETKAALRTYQQAHNLTGDGQLDSATIASLNLPKTDAMAPAAPSQPQTSSAGAPSSATVSAPPPSATAPAAPPPPAAPGSTNQ